MANRIKHFTGTAGSTFHSGVPVKSFRGGRMIGGASMLLDVLPQLLADAVTSQANDVLELAQENIRSHPKRDGVALGAGGDEEDVAVSGYVSTGNPNAFEKAKNAMIETASRDARRGLFSEAVTFEQPSNGFRAVVSFAAGRAKLMHDGYGGLSGTPFLDDAFDSLEKLMQGHFIEIGDALAAVNVPTFMDVDHQRANEMNTAMEKSYRYIMLGPGMNLMGHGARTRDAKMRRASDRKAARDTDAAAELRALRQTIAKVNRARR